jgi:hypothetical protein
MDGMDSQPCTSLGRDVPLPQSHSSLIGFVVGMLIIWVICSNEAQFPLVLRSVVNSFTEIMKMVDFFQNLFEYGPFILIMCLPFLFCIWAAYRSTSWRRRIAVGLVLATGFILAFEIFSLLQKSTLTSLLTILATPVVLVCIMLLTVAEGMAKITRSRNRVTNPDESNLAQKEKDA